MEMCLALYETHHIITIAKYFYFKEYPKILKLTLLFNELSLLNFFKFH